MANYTIKNMPMTCGSAEAESRKYHLHRSKRGVRYLVADQENAADNIYVEGGPNSEGFGGRTLNFKLVDGSIIPLQGPWHTNSSDLFNATGIDIRDKHLTFGVVAMEREGNLYNTVLKNVLYQDEKPVVGEFKRIEKIAQKFADDLGKSVIYYSQSTGGSSCGPVHPSKLSEGANL